MNPSAKQIAKWEAIRAKGERRFILFWGILVFGSISFVAAVALDFLMRRYDKPLWSWLLDFALDLVIVSLIGGVIYGWVIWRFMEWRYARYIRRV